MNPHHHHSSNQNPATASALQQINSTNDQQMRNGFGGLYPNTGPIVAPSCFMNFPNHPFPLQNTTGKFPNSIGGFNPQQNFDSLPVNQFYPSQQQGQFFANNSMVPTLYNQNVSLPNQQALLHNTIQIINQLLQLQNPNQAHYPPGNAPMSQNQIANVMSNQNTSGSVPTRQLQNLFATMANYQEDHGNISANANGGWAESHHKYFSGHKRSDASHTGFKSPLHHTKHLKQKLRVNNRSMNKDKSDLTSWKYTKQEIKQWREARKKNFPSNANMEKRHRNEEILLSDVTNQEAMLRRQQLKEILAKQAELGCHVAEIPASYLSDGEKHIAGSNKRKRGKFHKKRATRFQSDRTAKKVRRID